MPVPAVPSINRGVQPPKKWVDQADPIFRQISMYALLLRLGSASFTEFERGQVTFKDPSLLADGKAFEESEAPALGGGRMSAREFVQRAYARGRDFFDNEATTSAGRRPRQGDLKLLLLDAHDKVLAALTTKLRIQTAYTVDLEDTPHMAGEVRESARTTGDIARTLANGIVSMSNNDGRYHTETQRWVEGRLDKVCDGYEKVIDKQREIQDDLVIATDKRARADEVERFLEERERNKRGWFDRFMESEAGQQMLPMIAGAVVPGCANLFTALTSTAAQRLEVVQLRGQAKAKRVKRELELELELERDQPSNPPTPTPKSSPKPATKKVERNDPSTLSPGQRAELREQEGERES